MSRLVVRAAVTVMLVSTATWMVSGPTVTATVLRAWARRMAVELLQLSLRLQGRTFGAPGLTARARPEARPDRRAANLCTGEERRASRE